MVDRIVIVGGGVAAQRCAMALRREGFAGAVAMISAEDQAPYDRTLLSKDLLTSEELGDHVPLAASDDYVEAGIDLRLGVRAAGLEAARRRLALSDGDELSYDRLVVATGGRPVLPPALDAPGVLTLRGAADLPALRDALARARHVVVIGAGFIGGEVASAAVARHAPVTLVEAAGGPLAPVLGDEVAGRVAELHRAAGVELACDAPVRGVEQDRGALRVALANGRVLSADAVLVGVGMTPDVEWLAGSGIELDDGIVTGPACETSAPDVFAAGDCARWLHRGYGEHVRVEHWDTAARHGEAAAAGRARLRRAVRPAAVLLVRPARDEAAVGRPRAHVGRGRDRG